MPVGTYEAECSLFSAASIPVPPLPSPRSSVLSSPCPSLSQLQSSSLSVSSRCFMVRFSRPAPHCLTHRFRFCFSFIRAVLFPLCGERQGARQQAAAKPRGKPPPHPRLDLSFCPYNLGSFCPCVDRTFHSPPFSIWSSISFDFTSPSKGVRLLAQRIFTLAA